MKRKERKVGPHISLCLHYAFFIFTALSFLCLPDSRAIPVFIYINMFILIAMVVYPSARSILKWGIARRIKRNVKNKEFKPSRYLLSVSLMYVASFLMVIAIILIEGFLIYDYSVSFVIVSLALMFISTYCYISNPSGKLTEVESKVVWTARAFALGGAYFIFSVSKFSTMEYMDVTYEFASSRMVSYAFFIISFILFSFFLSGFAYIFITMFEKKTVEKEFSWEKGVVPYRLTVRYSAVPVAFPLVGLIAFIFFSYVIHKVQVDTFILRQSVELESSARFFCGGEYRTFRNGLVARFIKVTDKDYRAFIFTGGRIEPYRLSCIDTYPYYKLNYILHDEADVRAKMRADELMTDINYIQTGKPRKGEAPLFSSSSVSKN